MTLYDIWLYFLQTSLNTIKFFKDHPTVPGLIYLIFKQNSIRKIINKQLPKKFRDTVDSDILEIKEDVKMIKKHFGVVGEWQSNGQQNGLKRHPLSFRRPFLFLLTALKHQKRRVKNMLMNILKANLSKKLISAIVSIGVVALNQKFNLNLSENDVTLILGLSLAHISLQTIIDSIKAWAIAKSAAVIQQGTADIKSGIKKAILDPNTTYQTLFPKIKDVHDGVQKIYQDAFKNDGSQVCKDALQVYTQIYDVFQSMKPPVTIPEVVEQVSA